MENLSWVKLYRKLADHEMWSEDNKASFLFVTLLMKADRRTATWTGGRKKLALMTGYKESTVWGALLRLQNRQMVCLSTDSKKTRVLICNFERYQQQTDNKPTAARQQTDTIQEERIKNKEINSNVEVQRTYDFFIEKFGKNPKTYKLTPARTAKIKARLKDAGEDMVRQAIEKTAASPFHQGDNERGWKADLDFIVGSYEKLERLANLEPPKPKHEEFEINRKAWA